MVAPLMSQMHIMSTTNVEQTEEPQERKSEKERLQFIPNDVITGILAYLPVKSLLRLKCMSKDWSSAIQDRWFVYQHESLARTAHIFNQDVERECFEPKCSAYGLLLEMNKHAPNKCRIRNPSLRQVLYLPDSPRLHQKIYSLEHVKKSYEDDDLFKVIAIWEENENGNLGCEVLDVGIDKQWRTLEVPGFHRIHGLRLRSAHHVLYFVQVLLGDNRPISCLDLVNERFHSCTLPRCLVEHAFFPTRWRQNLAFVRQLGKDRHAVVELEDYKTEKWQKFVFRSTLFKEMFSLEKDDKLFLVYLKSTEFAFISDEITYYFYDSRWADPVMVIEAEDVPNISISFRPSLVTVQGMKFEDKKPSSSCLCVNIISYIKPLFDFIHMRLRRF